MASKRIFTEGVRTGRCSKLFLCIFRQDTFANRRMDAADRYDPAREKVFWK